MNSMPRLVLTLAAVAIFSALLLTGVDLWTSPIVEENIAQMHQEVLEEFFPEMETYQEEMVDEVEYDFVYDDEENFLGVLVHSTASGYGGAIDYYLAVNHEGIIEGMNIVYHEETPGIGDIVEDPDFQNKFVGKDYEDPIEPEEDIDVVSGATDTSEAMIDSVREHMDLVSDNILEKGEELK